MPDSKIPTANYCVTPQNLTPLDAAGFEQLAALALDMRWSWNHASDALWRKLDPDLWELTHNPWAVLQTVARAQIQTLLAIPEYKKEVERLLKIQQKNLCSPAWFQEKYPKTKLQCVAYFSMEFMLSEALPIYSGGLGNVAGDQLKAASDLGVPVIGVGLLYQQGYFRQFIDKNGNQQALYPFNDPGQLPITPVRETNGDWLRLKVTLSGHSVWLRAWQAQVGRVKLYLLDTNDAANLPMHRAITSELYGGDSEMRLQQELLLGMGGWRLLEVLDIHPDVCHLNEGHAAFAVLERTRSFMLQNSQSFSVAFTATRAGNLFTTHTAVEAGFDRFDPALIEQYLKHYAEERLGISLKELLSLGRKNSEDDTELFNMAYLAIRGCGAVNAVSELHGRVSQHLFEPLFSQWPHAEIPIGHITNGVHMPTWDSAAADTLWTDCCGKNRWRDLDLPLEKNIRSVKDENLWQFRNDSRKQLIEYTRVRLGRQLAASGASAEELMEIKTLLNPNVLTLGFARRFATYKRNNLLLKDPARLLRLLTHPDHPVQLIIAGKAHPQDLAGQAQIAEWIRFIRQPDVRPHIVFLSDYDMQVSEQLVQGVDLWINTPRRPWEASGTSGMKVLVNGGINLSELDGWWAEAYSPELGWALGDGLEHGDSPEWDTVEATKLYEILEHQVIPEFYQRNAQDIPQQWLNRIRESMAQLTPRFSASRSVREYTEQLYLPAAENYQQRASKKGAVAKKIADWKTDLNEKWNGIYFGARLVDTQDDQHHFEIEIFLNGIDPDKVRAELYADANDTSPCTRQPLTRANAEATSKKQSGTTNASPLFYRAQVSATRPATDFTARLIPYFEGVSVPLESPHIKWQV